MHDCIFCKIVKGEIPSKKAFENDRILAFSDINPQAPVHVLIIPKAHIESLAVSEGNDQMLLGEMMSVVKVLAKEFNLNNGFRVVSNTGSDAGQLVPHLHFHLLGGRKLGPIG